MDLFSIAIDFKMWGAVSENSYDADNTLGSLCTCSHFARKERRTLTKELQGKGDEDLQFLGPSMLGYDNTVHFERQLQVQIPT